MTRSGVVESIHAFAGGEIGTWFQVFLFVIASLSLFTFFYRFRSLLGTHRLESLLSREAAFFLNNLVLVLIGTVIFFLSFYDKISHDWFGTNVKNQAIFNVMVTPFFAILLFLTAVGPILGWVKTSPGRLVRNLLGPIVATGVYLGGVYAFLYSKGLLGTAEEVLIPEFKDQHPSALYPTGLFMGLSFFICATVASEFFRGMKSRMKFRKESLATAFFQLVLRHNRRYGGYLTHVGVAIITTGIIVSSMFKIEEHLNLKVGQSAAVGPYVVTALDHQFEPTPQPGEPYAKDEVRFRVTRATGENADPGGELVADLTCERRFYPKKNQWISEVSIDRSLSEDVYLHYAASDASGTLALTVFLNPLMILIYLGWFTMIAGALFAALPIPGSRVGLSD
jgi:cytochrome c-type biogenesis protein CcmF